MRAMGTLRVRDLPPNERPRERLAQLGAEALSSAELIAILLGTGTTASDVMETAQRLLLRFDGSLPAIARCTVAELEQSSGIGAAKATVICAAFGLAARFSRETVSAQKIDTPAEVCRLLAVEFGALHRESLRVLLLNTRHRLLRVEEISLGTINETLAHPREVFRPAILHSAAAIILAHNHPSGDATPSDADRRLTTRLAEAALLLQIKFVDHVIVGVPRPGQAGYFSFREAGLL